MYFHRNYIWPAIISRMQSVHAKPTMNFWSKLPKPFFIQAPMEDVTDTVFRQMLAKTARPDVFFTEFTNVDGMLSEGKQHVIHRLRFSESERPIVAQLWGGEPENYYQAAKYVREQGFDGIDINMGCPQKDVIKKGLCAALIENHSKAREIIEATIAGAQEAYGDYPRLPVSVKTRIGIKKPCTEEWVSFLLTFDIAALIIHGRTVKEMSLVPAHWEEIGKAVEIRNKLEKSTLIVGNGDITSKPHGVDMATQYGVDGVMIGRGILHDPWVFSDNSLRSAQADNVEPIYTAVERISTYLNHIQLHEETWGSYKHFERLKKYMKMYVRGFTGSSELRMNIAAAKNIHELQITLKDALADIA